jgi:hypothetical protein
MLAMREFESNITSQNGEDGVLAELFQRIGTTNRQCIEFGAWDGKHLSNTWPLWAEQDWHALLIEGDAVKCADLKRSIIHLPNVKAVCRFVASSGPNSLDVIASENRLPVRPDLLSIDIDGDDLAVFASLNILKPRVVVIEYNPTIPPDVCFQQQTGGNLGSSALAIESVARQKGYRLAHITTTNLIWVCREDFDKAGITEPSIVDDFRRDHLTWVVMSYSGHAFLTRSRLPYRPEPLRFSLVKQIRTLLRNARLWFRNVNRVSTVGLVPVDIVRKPGCD